MKFKTRTLVFIFILFSLPFLCSFILNFLLYNSAKQYYRELNSVRLDPLGLTVYPMEENKPVKSSSNQPKVVFFGDSRASAWSEPSNLDKFEFINRGIGSQTTTQVIERYDDHVAPLAPAILVVQVGINDLKTIPLFPRLQDKIIARCKANLEQIVLKARKQNTVVIFSTIFPVGKLPIARRLFWSADVDRAIDEVNEFIYKLADEDVLIFETKSVLANDKGVVKDEYRLDFLHLNETGYMALNQELVSWLQPWKLTLPQASTVEVSINLECPIVHSLQGIVEVSRQFCCTLFG